jgi:putative flippase GtrA
MWLKRAKFFFAWQLDQASMLIPEFSRFTIAGGLNTLLTIGIYQVTLTLLGPNVAYMTAWLAGLVIVSLAYPKLVFRLQTTLLKRMALASQYIGVFLSGIFLLDSLVIGGIHPRIAVLIVAAISAIVSYTASRLLLTRGASQQTVVGSDAAKI